MEIFDLRLEQYLIAGILRHPEIFPDVDGYITENDFKNRLHQVIWSVIKNSLLSKEVIDKVLIAQKIDKLALSFEDKISSVADYLEEISLIETKAQSVKHTARELKTVTIRRNIAHTGLEISDAMEKHSELNSDQIVALSDKIYTKIVNNFKSSNEPVDLFKGAEEYIASLSENDLNEEILSPYPAYQKYFGGYFPGDLVLFASAPKSGKSTIISDLMRRICESAEKVKGLIVDTELETYRVQRRTISAISGVNEYLIKSKKWRLDPLYVQKVKEALEQMKAYYNKIDHIYVGNVSTEEMASVVRRWHWRNIHKKNCKGIVAVDYFKLTGADNVLDAFASSMSLGYRVDTFKKLASELQIPIIGACQTNKMNQVGLSHEVNKFVSSLFLFERKSAEEIGRDELDVNSSKKATHKLTPLYTRDLGEHFEGINDLVQVIINGKKSYVPNYINYRLENFTVTELGDLREIVSRNGTYKMNIKNNFVPDLLV